MKDILITGANGGMGGAAAELLAAAGYRVFALDLTERQPSKNIIPIKSDVTSEESVEAAFKRVKQYTGSLYAILHYAGIYMLDSLAEMESDSFRQIFRVNVEGAFLVNRRFLPLLDNGSRIIIVTSELATLDPLPFTGIYAVTKAALDKLPENLRVVLILREYAELNYKEIGRVLGITEGNVKVRIFRAREQLAKIIGENDVYLP